MTGETDTRTPFTVRGHHALKSYVDLMCIRPKSLAPRILVFLEYRNDKDAKRRSVADGEISRVFYDTYGKTFFSRRRYNSRKRQVYAEFLALPYDYPVEIIAGSKDKICECPIVGNHCLRSRGGHFDETRLRRDIQGINTFIRLASPDQFRLGERTTEFIDRANFPVKSVTTTAGTLRQVLRQYADKFFSLPSSD